MKLTLENLKNREAWERAGISLPAYDVAALAERTKKAPVWVHMGIGNIFRIFMGLTFEDQIYIFRLNIITIKHSSQDTSA